MSYTPSGLYSFKKNLRAHKQRLFDIGRRYLPGAADEKINLEFYNDGAFAFIGITDDAFLASGAKNTLVLKDFSALKEKYRPKLLGTKNIGVMCAPRRLYPDRFEKALEILLEKLPSGSAVKLHPGFKAFSGLPDRMAAHLKKLRGDSVFICPEETILELEMLYEPKTLIGAPTSLRRYAKVFGSTFETIKLY